MKNPGLQTGALFITTKKGARLERPVCRVIFTDRSRLQYERKQQFLWYYR